MDLTSLDMYYLPLILYPRFLIRTMCWTDGSFTVECAAVAVGRAETEISGSV